MTVSMANYVFLPWVRQGAASGIQTLDTLGANQAGIVAVPVKLRVNDAHDIDQQVRLYGPGDVTGMDPQQVVRTVPRHLALDLSRTIFRRLNLTVRTFHGSSHPPRQTRPKNCAPGSAWW